MPIFPTDYTGRQIFPAEEYTLVPTIFASGVAAKLFLARGPLDFFNYLLPAGRIKWFSKKIFNLNTHKQIYVSYVYICVCEVILILL